VFIRRWSIRLVIAGAVLILIVPTFLISWGLWENRQFNREIAAIKAAGEPSVVTDLDSPAVAAAENQVPELQAAARLVQKQTAAFKAIDDLNGPMLSVRLPLREDEHKLVQTALAASAGVFPLVDSATTKPSVGLGLKFTSPAIGQLLPEIMENRALANALQFEAYDAQTTGDTTRALRGSGQILDIGRVTDHVPNLIGHLVSIGIDAVAHQTIGDVAADVGRKQKPLSDDAREEAKRLIAELLDDTANDEGFRRALRGERAISLDAMQAIADGRLNPAGVAATPTSPAARMGRQAPRGFMLRNGRAINWFYADMLKSLEGAHDLTTFRKAYKSRPIVAQGSPKLYLLANLLIPSIERAANVHFRSQADRRLAATALAIMLYRADHEGAFPKSLEELVPKYLPAVPADPLAKPGVPIGYVADADRPRIYSVGENGVDNGGAPIDSSKTKAQNDQLSDVVIDLVPQPRPLPETRESDGFDEP
jgi:hypothetical protein